MLTDCTVKVYTTRFPIEIKVSIMLTLSFEGSASEYGPLPIASFHAMKQLLGNVTCNVKCLHQEMNHKLGSFNFHKQRYTTSFPVGYKLILGKIDQNS